MLRRLSVPASNPGCQLAARDASIMNRTKTSTPSRSASKMLCRSGIHADPPRGSMGAPYDLAQHHSRGTTGLITKWLKNPSRLLAGAMVLVSVFQVGCAMDTYGGRGAALGGLSGAAVGAAIGDHSNNALLGSAVGALAGATVGSAVGNQVDADVQQARFEATQMTQQNMSATLNQVVGMSQQGVSNEVIVNQIRTQGVPRPITSNEVIQLKQQGVSDQVIAALQMSSPVQPVSYAAQSPVIVEEIHHWGPPVVYRPYRRGYSCAPPHHRGGLSWGFSYHGH